MLLPRLLQGDHAVGPTARSVALGLSMHANRRMEAWPGSGTLATELALSVRAVRNNLDVLESAGWIQLLEQGGLPGGRRTSLWKLVTPAPLAGVTHPTLEPPAGVTLERGAGVQDATPAPPSTTLEPRSTTPAPPATELEELEELEEGDALTVARQLVSRHHDELPDLLAELQTERGNTAITHALTTLQLDGRRYQFPSGLRTAITNTLNQTPAPHPARPPCPLQCHNLNIEINGRIHRCPHCTNAPPLPAIAS
ncbi:MAG: hypothetical protein JWN46_78 [Acidimicrobiales bacterium]|nr:hypothetical protein [Acidimicrobiales bacterium]